PGRSGLPRASSLPRVVRRGPSSGTTKLNRGFTMSRFAHTRRGGWLIAPFLISAAALVVAGCGGSSKASAGNGATASPQPATPVGAPGATVRFLTPRAGSAVTGSSVRVHVRVSGFTLAPGDVGKAARQGFGHLHFSLDGGRYDTPR